MAYSVYVVTVSAKNSKAGVERCVEVRTDPLDIPTEKFVYPDFTPENLTLSWKDPLCSTWTGPVNGSRLFFTGISPNVKDFRDQWNTPWHTFQLDRTKSQDIHGLETYLVKIHLTHAFMYDKYNSTIFAEKEFTTPASAPPKVRNLTIVEVDTINQRITLKWRKPLPPTNGHIIEYQIKIPTSLYTTATFTLNATEPCDLWYDFTCATVDRSYTSFGHIEVRARNEDVAELGEAAERTNVFKAQVPSKPRSVTASDAKNGTVDLQWLHPWTTGIPMIAFRITYRVNNTNLTRPLNSSEKSSSLNISISKYERRYSTRLYLLPSTSYEIGIEGIGNHSKGLTATAEVKTAASLRFGPHQQPTHGDESQINIFIPAIVNDTKNNTMNVILIGPKPCSSSWSLTDNLARSLKLEPGTIAWHIEAAPSSEIENRTFVIGSGNVNHHMANCPLPNGTYEVGLLVHHKLDKSTAVLSWRSQKIQIGPPSTASAAAWIVPLVVIIAGAAGYGGFYVRKRNQIIRGKQKTGGRAKDSQSFYRETSLLVTSRESMLGQPDIVQTTNISPIMEEAEENEEGSGLIKLKDFKDYVKEGIVTGTLNIQYAKFPRGKIKPWEYGEHPENKSKNRYGNLIAYDETRVKLEKLPDDPYSDYINANYIKGYRNDKAYIASQGPRPNTVIDFWRMIWQERVQVICMLANVLEGGKKKCEQYWPDIGKERRFGDIIVHNFSHTAFADYTFRTFSITCNEETRKVEHLHYTAWPDHGVPLYVQSVVTYLKKLLAIPLGHGPIVVHCSAGIGRTGTIILCDICLRKAAAEGALDIFAETMAMRNQRANMVDNKQQYLLAHLALVECLLSLPTAIPCNDNLPMKIQEYKMQLALQQQSLQESVWQDSALQSNSNRPMEISKNNSGKNRFPALAAVVGPTLHLSRYPTTDNDSDYIFGVYVDSAMRKNDYIATQLPLPSTVNDFWRMVAEFNVEVIIVLQSPNDEDPTCCEFIPKCNEELHPTPFLNLRGKKLVDEDICTNQTVLITDSSSKSAEEQTVTVLSLKGWASGEGALPPKPITLVNFWQYGERIHRGVGPTVVLCHDGVTNCGLYLALNFLLQRMGLERECDVCLAIRAIRKSRPDFCESRDQFEYLYDTALIYADYFETYANFT